MNKWHGHTGQFIRDNPPQEFSRSYVHCNSDLCWTVAFPAVFLIGFSNSFQFPAKFSSKRDFCRCWSSRTQSIREQPGGSGKNRPSPAKFSCSCCGIPLKCSKEQFFPPWHSHC